MIVGSRFPGDQNRELMDVQFELYWQMVAALYEAARSRYLNAADLLAVDTDLAARLRDGSHYFDHRTLQAAHDLIADFYRFAHDDHGQLQLGETADEYRQRHSLAWAEFFHKERWELVRCNDLTRDILEAVVYAGEERGWSAARLLLSRLEDRYSHARQTLMKDGE